MSVLALGSISHLSALPPFQKTRRKLAADILAWEEIFEIFSRPGPAVNELVSSYFFARQIKQIDAPLLWPSFL